MYSVNWVSFSTAWMICRRPAKSTSRTARNVIAATAPCVEFSTDICWRTGSIA